jgi:hypothetical protein
MLGYPLYADCIHRTAQFNAVGAKLSIKKAHQNLAANTYKVLTKRFWKVTWGSGKLEGRGVVATLIDD